MLNERDRIEKKIARMIKQGFMLVTPLDIAKAILNIPELCILSDNQELPENPNQKYDKRDGKILSNWCEYDRAQDRMIMSNFKRVISKL